jgi:hypothetical protein
MIPQNIEMLIKALIEKTNSKQAIWGKTSRPNEFKMHFEKGAITTDYWRDDDDFDNVDIGIYNSFGDRIDNYFARRDTSDFELIMALYNTAKREFYKVDETIDFIFSEVKSDKSIGKREIEGLGLADDLPF